MRQILLDTETTGLSAADGHRIVEIACLELVDRRSTGRQLHRYLNPERDIDAKAFEVHGLTRDRLSVEPRFAEIAEELLQFVDGAQVLIHNAPFDIAFLDAELQRVGAGSFRDACAEVIDTLELAKQMHPGKRNSLDALCDRYGISNAHRKLHGALLDAELLSEVFLAMTRGQESLEMALHAAHDDGSAHAEDGDWPPQDLVVRAASDEERAAHDALLAAIARDARGPSIWTRLENPAD